MNIVDLLDTDLIDVDYPSIKSTLKNSKDLSLGVALSGLISTSKLQPEQTLTITPDNYSNVIYWKAI